MFPILLQTLSPKTLAHGDISLGVFHSLLSDFVLHFSRVFQLDSIDFRGLFDSSSSQILVFFDGTLLLETFRASRLGAEQTLAVSVPGLHKREAFFEGLLGIFKEIFDRDLE